MNSNIEEKLNMAFSESDDSAFFDHSMANSQSMHLR